MELVFNAKHTQLDLDAAHRKANEHAEHSEALGMTDIKAVRNA